jgi:undecaprenyl-diphosphatase
MDHATTQWINAWAGSSALLDMFMIAITQYGVPLLVLLVVVRGGARETGFT